MDNRTIMPKYSKKDGISEQTKHEAMAIAKGIQKPGQTKEQTKLVAQGIQKGIDLYKKQQKSKARELDKQLKKAKQAPLAAIDEPVMPQASDIKPKGSFAIALPWCLLVLSWLAFGVYTVRIA